MKLKEQCIKFAEQRQRESEIESENSDKEFSAKVVERIREILSFETHCYSGSPVKYSGNITVIRIAPGQLIYEVEGIKFQARKRDSPISVTVLKHCDVCGNDWESYSVGCKADVGQAIQAEHPQYECNKTEIKTTPAERLEELIREIALSQ